ncbi:SIR2 family protein, partial [Mesorhizobium sp. M2A.F.Ca.ET.037.01.1.1]
MADENVAPQRQFQIVRNGDSTPAIIDWTQGVETVQKGIADALNARNVAFLLGAGCSSLRIDGEERGISTMQPLAEMFCNTTTQALAAAQQAAEDEDLLGEDTADLPPVESPDWVLTREEVAILQEAGVELEDEYARNLERLMEVLHSLRFVSQRSAKSSHWTRAKELTQVVNKVQAFLWEQCTDGAFANGDTAVRDLYEKFYRKLVLRDRSLPRPWVFTTNYDLFNETAMDRLGIPYANGFSGIIERRFNPSTFRYALAEQLDLSNRKWSAVDAFVYLCKLHGSISWTEDDHGLFPI